MAKTETYLNDTRPAPPQGVLPVGPAPLVPLAIGLILGILLDAWAPLPWLAYLAGFAVVAGVSVRAVLRRRFGLAIALIAATCAGGLLHHERFRRVGPEHVYQYTSSAPIIARVRATVVSDPRTFKRSYPPFERWSYESHRTSFFADADAIELLDGFARTHGRLRVTVKDAVLSLREGDRVELFGYLYRPFPPANPGQFDWALRDRRAGILAGMSCQNAHNVPRLNNETRVSLRTTWGRFRRHTRGLLLGDMVAHGGREMSLLEAMVLGRRGAIDRQLNEAFIRTGCAHFLAVSGMHVCMLGAFFWFIARMSGISRRGCAITVVAVTLCYALLVEPRPPIFRATTMTVIYCVSLLIRRPRNIANTIALAAVLLLCWQPTTLFNPGFQLSFAAVLGIVYVSPLLERTAAVVSRHAVSLVRRRDPTPIPDAPDTGRSWRAQLRLWFRTTLAVAVAAWLANLPLVMIHFQRVSAWGWLNTILLAPLVFLVMVAGFLKILCGICLPGFAGCLTPLVDGAATLLTTTVDGLSQLPGVSMSSPPMPHWLAVLCYAVLVAWVCAHRNPRWWRTTMSTLLSRLHRSRRQDSPENDNALTLTVLPVGQALTTLIEMPDGRVVLYDAGHTTRDGRGSRVVWAYLFARGIERIDVILVSHPHRDHYNSVVDLIGEFDTGPVCITPYFEQFSRHADYSSDLLRCLRGRNHPVATVSGQSTSLRFGPARIEFLWPPLRPPFPFDENNSSLVVRLSCHDRSVLLCGDIRDDAQAWLAHQTDVAADVLVLPHHGAVTEATPRFVTETGATHLVCSRAAREDAEDGPLTKIIADRQFHDTAQGEPVEIALTDGEVSVAYSRRPATRGWNLARHGPVLTAAAALFVAALVWLWPVNTRDGLTFTTLAVGRGTSTVLELPNGQTLLYDTGASGTYDPGRSTIMPYLRHRGVRRVDAVILSHSNLDHFGGLPTVVDRIATGPVLVSPHFEPLSTPDKPSRVLLEELRRREHPIEIIHSGQAPMRFGDVTLEILWPPLEAPFELSANDSSLVIRARYRDHSILLTGDIGYSAQQWLLDNTDLAADVLLLPHHGGVDANTRAFIDAVDPCHFIRSTSERNEITRNGLLDIIGPRPLHNTADHGAITVTINETGLHVATAVASQGQ